MVAVGRFGAFCGVFSLFLDLGDLDGEIVRLCGLKLAQSGRGVRSTLPG